MIWLLVLSISLRVLAALWSLTLAWRMRDARMLFLTALLAFMTSRQLLTLHTHLTQQGTPGNAFDELPGLLVSSLMLGVVFLVDHLLVTERQHSKLIESVPDIVFSIAPDGTLLSLNPAFERITGRKVKHWVGRTCAELLHPHDLEKGRRLLRGLRDGKPIQQIEIRFLGSGGETIVADLSVGPVTNGGKAMHGIGVARDGTRRAAMQRELENLQRRYRQLFEEAPLMYVVTGRFQDRSVITECNRHFLEALGYDESEVLGQPLERFQIRKPARQRSGDGDRVATLEAQLVKRDGGVIEVLARSSMDRTSSREPAGIRTAFTDVSALKRIESELYDSQRRLRALNRRLESVREEERTEIARGLHDDLGQALTSLKMDLSYITLNLGEDSERLRVRLESMEAMIDESFEIVRDVSTRLRPPILDNLGLVPAIEWQLDEFQRRSGIACELDRARASALEPRGDRDTLVFRTLQEALTNVARHATASRIQVALRPSGRDLVLDVVDDGRGITEAQLADSTSLGIIGMRERAAAAGGTIRIERLSGGGTRVRLRVPCDAAGHTAAEEGTARTAEASLVDFPAKQRASS